MLIDPRAQMQQLQQQARLVPQTPGFSSPWEKMAFQGGGMLGGAIGNKFLLQPKMQELQAQETAQNKSMQGAMETENPVDRYSKASELLAGLGRFDDSAKYAKLSVEAQKGQLEKDKLARRITKEEYNVNQDAIDNEFKEKRLGIEQQRADAYTTSTAYQSSTSAEKFDKEMSYLNKRKATAKASGDTDLVKQIEAYISKKAGIKEYSTGGTKGIKTTRDTAEELASSLMFENSTIKDTLKGHNAKAYYRSIASRVNKEEQKLRKSNTPYDLDKLIQAAHNDLQAYIEKPTGVLAWFGETTFNYKDADKPSSKEKEVKTYKFGGREYSVGAIGVDEEGNEMRLNAKGDWEEIN